MIKQTNNMKQLNKEEFQAFIDKVLPKASKSQQEVALKSLIRQANRESRLDAIRDPLSRIPMAWPYLVIKKNPLL